MDRKIISLLLVLILLLPMSFAEIQVNTAGQDTSAGSTNTIEITHSFEVDKYYPTYNYPQYGYTDPNFKHSIEIVPIVSEQNISSCQKAEYSFQIKNVGASKQIYKFEIREFAGKSGIVPTVSLEPGEANIIKYELEPECGVSGEFNPYVYVQAQDNKEEALVPVGLKVSDDFDYSVYTEDEASVCNGVETRIPVLLHNAADIKNNYTLSTNKDWAKFEYNYLDVDAGSQARVDLVLSPDFKTDASSLLTVSFGPNYGAATSKKINVEAKDCYGQKVSLTQKQACETDNSFNVELKNNGLYNETFEVQLYGPDFMSLEDTRYEVPAGSQVPVRIDLAKGAEPGKHDFTVKSYILGLGESFSQEVKGTVEILDSESCYEPQLLTDKLTVSHDNETRVLEIKNTGLYDETYYLETPYPDWLSLEDYKVTVPAGNQEAVRIKTNPGSDVKQGTYQAAVLLTSDKTDNTYTEDFQIKVSDYTFIESIVQNKCSIFFVILALLGLLFFIRFIMHAVSGNKRSAIADLVVLLLVLLLMVINVSVCFNSFAAKVGLHHMATVDTASNECQTHFDDEICSSDYYLRMDEDTKLKIDLSDWFYDPDGDTLSYGAEEIGDVNVKVMGSEVELIPDKNWYGVKEIVFYAEDGKGGFAESRKFYLHVLDVKEPYLQDFLLDYHVPILFTTGIILVLVFIILVLSLLGMPVAETEDKKEDDKEKDTESDPDEEFY